MATKTAGNGTVAKEEVVKSERLAPEPTFYDIPDYVSKRIVEANEALETAQKQMKYVVSWAVEAVEHETGVSLPENVQTVMKQGGGLAFVLPPEETRDES